MHLIILMHKRTFQSVVILLRASVLIRCVNCIGPRCFFVAFSWQCSPCFSVLHSYCSSIPPGATWPGQRTCRTSVV